MILIKDGRLIDPKSGTDEVLDVVLDGAKVKNIGRFHRSDRYEEIVEAAGKIVTPGFVDVHVHFRDPGLTYKEDISTGAAAAARGGFTSVVCMANTKPPVDNAQTLALVLAKAKRQRIHVYTVACVSKGMLGRELTDMDALFAGGAAGFSDDGIPLTDSAFVQRAMRKCAKLGAPISLHEEDPALIGSHGVNRGRVSEKLGVSGAPAVSESSLVARDCMIALDTGAAVNIQHVSSAVSVEAIRLAKSMGAHVWAEATPHHFSLTENDTERFGAMAKVNPPLRTENDRYAIIRGLQDGTIDLIASDHAPHSAEEKSKPFAEAPSGMIGLETSLALGLTHLVHTGHLSLLQLVGKMSWNPARLYHLDAGYLAEGGPADLVIFDEQENWKVESFASKAKNSPFLGQTLSGKVKACICAGQTVYCDNDEKGGQNVGDRLGK